MLDRLLALPLIGVLPWAIGQWLRDRWWLTGLFFYIPSPVLLTALLLSAGLLWIRKRRRAAGLALLVSALPAFVVASLENQWHEPPSPLSSDELTLVHWNVAGGWLGWDRTQRRLAEHPADVYVLSELPTSIRRQRVAWFGDGMSMVRNGSLGLACRGFVHGRTERPRSELKLLYAACQVGSRELAILAIDLPSSLRHPRRPLLREVGHWLRHYQPDITVGDFNAPRRSLGLSTLPPGFTHAYRRAGAGWSYTWPVPLPVLAIDQCIVGPRVEPAGYTLSSSLLSDHRIQALRFSVTGHHP